MKYLRGTSKSFSEALILASTQYDKSLFIDLQVQYIKVISPEHFLYINCSECQNKTKQNTCTQHVLSLQFSCSELVIQ